MPLPGNLPPDVLFGVALPVLWGGLVWFVAFPFWSRRSLPDAVIFGLVLPFLIAIPGLRELPPLPPIAAEGWLFYLGIFALVAHAASWGMCGSRGCSRSLAAVGAVLAAGAATYPLYLSGALEPVAVLRIGGAVALASFFLQACLQNVSSRGGRDSAWVLFFITAGGAALLIFSGSAYLGLLAGTAAAALGPALLFGFFRKDLFVPSNAAAALGLILSGAAAQGYLYANMPLESALLFAASPGLASFGTGGTRIVGTLGFVVLAVLIAGERYFGY